MNLFLSNSCRLRAWRYTVCMLCIFVFLFSYSAKLSLYRSQNNLQANPVSATKLWLNDQKMEIQTAGSFLPALWLAVLLLNVVLVCTERPKENQGTPRPRHSSLLHLCQFLRPPPIAVE